MLKANDSARLDELFQHMQEANNCFLGYPFARGFDYEAIWRFLSLTGNNLGDPFEDGSYRVASRQFEREVIEFFALLFKEDLDDYWGYVTNGGTEGNIYGLYLAREVYRDGIVYFTKDTHYSVSKAVHLLGMRHVPVRSNPQGEMDYLDLLEKAVTHRHAPAIVVANIGTTMTEAKDDVQRIRSALSSAGVSEMYIHCDAALCGPFAPFLEPKPVFDFSEGADSITISGHKFIGAPMPCGVVVARKRHVNHVNRTVEYIGAMDTTLTGSRNAFTPIMLWYAIKSLGLEGIRERMTDCQRLAEYTVNSLVAHDVPAWRNQGALTVVFPKINDAVKMKYQLATQNVSHLIVMPGTTQGHVDAFVSALVNQRQPRSADPSFC